MSSTFKLLVLVLIRFKMLRMRKAPAFASKYHPIKKRGKLKEKEKKCQNYLPSDKSPRIDTGSMVMAPCP